MWDEWMVVERCADCRPAPKASRRDGCQREPGRRVLVVHVAVAVAVAVAAKYFLCFLPPNAIDDSRSAGKEGRTR